MGRTFTAICSLGKMIDNPIYQVYLCCRILVISLRNSLIIIAKKTCQTAAPSTSNRFLSSKSASMITLSVLQIPAVLQILYEPRVSHTKRTYRRTTTVAMDSILVFTAGSAFPVSTSSGEGQVFSRTKTTDT